MPKPVSRIVLELLARLEGIVDGQYNIVLGTVCATLSPISVSLKDDGSN